MAIDPKLIDGLQPESYGIGIRLTPGDPPTFGVELQRAPDDGGGGPGAFATITQLLPLASEATYVDLLPPDNAFRHYRWRHVAPGFDPSPSWSAVGRGKPTRLEGAAAAGGLISIYPIIRTKVMSDGKYALAASVSDGLTADADVKESGTKKINLLLAKPLAADPDTADSVEDGVNQRTVTTDEGNLLSGLGAQLAALGVALINGDFEDGLRFWKGTGTGLTAVASPVNTGAKAAQLDVDNAATSYLEQVDRSSDITDPTTGSLVYIPVDTSLPAQVYGRVWVRTVTGLQAAIIKLQVREYDSGKSLLRTTQVGNTVTNPFTTWTKIEGRAALGASTQYITVRVEVFANSGSTEAVIDSMLAIVYYPSARCKAYRDTDQTGIVSGTETLIALPAESYDYGALHDNVTNNSRVKVAAPGPVRGVAQVQFGAGSTGHRRVRVRKNGTTIIAEEIFMAVTTASTPTTVNVAFADDATAATDYYEILATHTQGANLSAIAGVGATFLEVQQGG